MLSEECSAVNDVGRPMGLGLRDVDIFLSTGSESRAK